MRESGQYWLSHAAAFINIFINATTGKTPHHIVYGFEKKRLPYDLLLEPCVAVC